MVDRQIIKQPGETFAGLAVTHTEYPDAHETEYAIEQLWPDGETGTVYVGDSADAIQLLETLEDMLWSEDTETVTVGEK